MALKGSHVAFHLQTLDRATTFHNLNFSTVTSLPVFPLFPFHPSKSKELLEAATALPWAELSFRCQRSSRARQDVAWALPEWLWIWGPRKQTREEEKQEEIGVKKAPRLKASSIQKHSSEPLTKPTRTRFRKKMSVLKLRVRSTALAPAGRVRVARTRTPMILAGIKPSLQSYWDLIYGCSASPTFAAPQQVLPFCFILHTPRHVHHPVLAPNSRSLNDGANLGKLGIDIISTAVAVSLAIFVDRWFGTPSLRATEK